MSLLRRRMMSQKSATDTFFKNYLTIEALEDGLTASLSVNACQYCVDGDGNWKSLSADKATPAISAGHFLSFRATNLTPTSDSGIGTFTITKKCNLAGDVMSMLYGDNAPNQYAIEQNYAFYQLFNNSATVIDASRLILKATTLSQYCYSYMFSTCSNLESAPEIAATSVANYCCYYMFNNCKNLQSAPTRLPAITMVQRCYSCMFRGCTTLTTAPELPATTLADRCYASMFYGCSSLTTAPVLPAETLTTYCYQQMFYNCSELNYIKAMFLTVPNSNVLSNWVRGVAASGTFVKNANATWDVTGNSGVPEGWTVISEAA